MSSNICHHGGSRLPAIEVVQNTYSHILFVESVSAAGSEYLRGVADSNFIVDSFSNFFDEPETDSLNLTSLAAQVRDFYRSLSSSLSLVEIIAVSGGRVSAGGGDGGPTIYEIVYDSLGPGAAKGQWVYIDSVSDEAILADSASPATAEVVGVLNEAVTSGGTAKVITEGEVLLSDWTSIAGTEFLSSGSVYYLQSNGQMRVTAPLSGAVVIIGRAISPTRFDVEISEPWIL